jgi:hypothetical protein
VGSINRRILVYHGNFFFQKLKGRKVNQVLSESGYQWDRGSYKERVKDSEYGESILYLWMKIVQ